MKNIFVDPFQYEYTVLFKCPFLKSNQLQVNMSKAFAYKALERKDMIQMIDKEWNEVEMK
jgi:hypothetical protein